LKFTLGSSALGSLVIKHQPIKKAVGFGLPTALKDKKNDQSIHGQTSPFKIKIKALPGSIV